MKKYLGKSVFLNGPFPASFSLFPSFLQTVNSKYMFIKSCRLLDLNPGPLVLEATALPTASQPLPNTIFLYYVSLKKELAL